jgi:ribonuclease III
VLLREDFQRRICYTFKNAELLDQALTHKSYANETRTAAHNERFEFLGDAVLNLVISEYLMTACPDSTEGDLSRLRASIVNEPSIAEVARTIGIGAYLLLGKGESLTGGREKNSLLANSVEALIAAIYLDAGVGKAESFILRFFNNRLDMACALRTTHDYKTELQELCQGLMKHLPEYRIVSETGPDHQKVFEVETRIKDVVYGRGSGKSKKEAEQHAAKEALKTITNKNSSKE